MLLPFDELDNIITKWTMPYLDLAVIDKDVLKDELIDDVYELLVLALVYGQTNVNDSLGTDVTLPTATTEGIIFKPIDGKKWDDRIAEYIDLIGEDENGKTILPEDVIPEIMRVGETETTRVLNEAEQATADEAQRQTKRTAVKTWRTMEDLRVRETHFFLHGVTIPASDEFWTIDDDHAKTPGGFGKAQNNVNCRCWLEYGWK